ncbi:50S ribosomal protein L7/L12 [Nonomuraea sp. NPDC050536]|uniref:50S ribosomal protein L7/L12 n=1 Tax=Nonomuraea sp. NPDC050536 TaxID=3364366 RepID=UPI0037C87F87
MAVAAESASIGLGLTEIIAIAFALIALAAVITITVYLATRRKPAPPSQPIQLPSELEHHLRQLIAQRQPIHAIKILRDHTGLDLRTAKNIVDAMVAGRDLPGHPPTRPPMQPDLATRVRELLQAGRTEQATFLVRGETGMDAQAAERFIASL